MIDTVQTLLRLTLLEDDDQRRAELATRLERVPAATWADVVAELDAHRITPLIAHTLRRFELEGCAPDDARTRLRAAYRSTLWANEVHARSLRELLTAFRTDGIEPIVFKGLVLGAGCYPDPGTRPMVDIDILIGAHELRRTVVILRALGYRRRVNEGVGNRNGFRNGLGIAVDLHWRFDLFPVEVRRELTAGMVLPALGPEPVLTWEPNAMVVHLAVHLTGHRGDVGMRLSWLLDFAFVVRSLGPRLQVDRLTALLPTPESRALLWRVLRFLERDCWLALPPHLAAQTAGCRGMTLGQILREGRLRPWGLPGLRGWLRVIGSRLVRGSRSRLRYPHLADLPLGMLDLLSERRDAQRTTATLQASR